MVVILVGESFRKDGTIRSGEIEIAFVEPHNDDLSLDLLLGLWINENRLVVFALISLDTSGHHSKRHDRFCSPARERVTLE
jgi:hypothetical protein